MEIFQDMPRSPSAYLGVLAGALGTVLRSLGPATGACGDLISSSSAMSSCEKSSSWEQGLLLLTQAPLK